ncbi:aldo/keto reductase [Spiractinospora alimapuensis]|uniref:aldo/keto reductase n=1 Tax=Spiractinospora alimapuensis TaxID=2820884 RepID=UPI001F235B06|nr:aldo/keto reductase [Spiractinospora alimapuensis]
MASGRTITIGGDITVPVVGQGTWRMGEDADDVPAEVRALRAGLDLGLTLIDTAEMYGEGGAERVVGEAVAGRRDDAVIVSKVYPHNAGQRSARRSCENSLRRLGTDHLDLYLLHWRGNIPLAETVEVMEDLLAEGKIRNWGVSNLDVDDMDELWSLPDGTRCATDQVLYHAASRGAELRLLPWCRAHDVPVMAYSPIAQAGRLRGDLLASPVINEIASGRGLTPAQVALAWVIRDSGVLAIPKAVQPEHVQQNAATLDVRLSDAEIAAIDDAFPPPNPDEPLDIV